MPTKKKRHLALGLALIATVAIVLLSWLYAQPASALPGYTCNPDAGHGTSGCHVPATSPPPTAAPPPPSTTPPRPATTQPQPATNQPTVSGTASTAVPSTDAGTPTTTTTDLATPIAGSVGSSGGGSAGGWIALTVALGAFALAGWIGMAVQWRSRRRTAAGGRVPVTGPVRFVLAERLAHWVYAFCFLVAGISGALMWIPSTRHWMAGARYAVSQYHGYVGLAMVLVPLLIFLVLDRRRLAEDRRALDEWGAHDTRWLWAALSGGMFRGKKMPPQGRFNAGQKVNSYLVAGVAVGFVVTGTLLLVRMHLPLWLTPGLLFAHQVLAVGAGLLFLGHLGMALFTRHGRAGLGAMTRGPLPAEVAREGHALWYAEWLRKNRGEDERPPVADAIGETES